MNLGNYAVSLIRTYVPMGVGVLVAWLVSLGVPLTDSTQTAIVSGSGVVGAAVYYALVRKAEQHWPAVGWLLGKAGSVEYGQVMSELDAMEAGLQRMIASGEVIAGTPDMGAAAAVGEIGPPVDKTAAEES